MKANILFYWATRIVAALILLQTLFFKFTASEESVYIFKTVGMEPWGRIGIGVFELIASVLILINSTAWLGALLAFGLMTGAIGMHLTLLGIEVQDDKGQLFFYALLVTACSVFILIRNRGRLFTIYRSLRRLGS